MLKKLLNGFSCLLAVLSFTAVTAQEYQTMPITSGLNADVIANGVGPAQASTSIDIDGVSFNYVATDYKLTSSSTALTYGVPANGLINSAVASTNGLSFQLAPLSGNNSLRLATATTTTGTITFTTPIPVATLYMLAVTGSGSGTVNAIVNFTDGTNQPFNGLTVSDWYGGPNAAIQGIGRIGRFNDVLEPNTINPRMYQITMAISATNQPKLVQSVQITKTASTGIEAVNIFAFSADRYVSCKSPTNITSVSNSAGGVFSWTAPSAAPPSGYEYYVTASATPPTDTTTPTGSVGAGVTTVTVGGLVAGQSYYFWLRSNCGGTDKGLWKMRAFTAGQVGATYTAGDISTSYDTAPTLTSVTACPGTLSVTVPPGYKIASVATNYTMTASTGGQQSQQRSLLVCTTNNTSEAAITNGPSVNTTGVATYNRSGLTFANNLTGVVNFELRAWRTASATPVCSTTANRVTNNSWTVTVTYELDACTTPATPTASAQTWCPGATVADLQSTGIVGAVYKWYDVAVGGTALPSTTVLVNGNYYVTQTIGSCESARSAAVAVTLAPTALPTADPQTFCNGATVANLLTTSGTNIKWYAAATGGAALAGTTALVDGNYYVTQTVNGCESARATIAITVNTTPPPASPAQTFCQGSGTTVANLEATTVTGATIKWYTSDTSTTPLLPTALVGTGTYYVSQVLGLCESLRTPVQVTVATVVNPTVFAQELCTGATVANLQATGSPSATYKWYESATSTTPLDPTTAVVGGTYYVSQTIAACESGRASVAVTLIDLAAPEVDSQEFCTGATVANLAAVPDSGATIRWYATVSSTTVLTATTPLVSGNYYVSQKISNCESSRTEVAVTVNDVTPVPTASAQFVCPGSDVSDLVAEVAEGATVTWYATNTSTTPLDAATALTATTYYVSQTIGICESARTPVAVTFNYVVAPTTESLAVCNGTTFAELTVEGLEGAVFTWYSDIDTTEAISGDAVVTAGTSYVAQTLDGCEGERAPVAISVTTTAQPAPAASQTFCGEAFVSDLTAGATTGFTVNWYSPEGELLAADSPLASGTYTVSQTANDCESTAVAVNVVVTAIPDAPQGAEEQEYTAGETVSDLDVAFLEGAELQWFFLDEDVWISIPAGTPLTDGSTYGVTQSIGECESDYFAVTANLVLASDAFALANLSVYPNPATDILNIEGRQALSEIIVVNLLGQQVLQQKASAETAQINISALPQATYILMVKAENGATASFKIVKQ